MCPGPARTCSGRARTGSGLARAGPRLPRASPGLPPLGSGPPHSTPRPARSHPGRAWTRPRSPRTAPGLSWLAAGPLGAGTGGLCKGRRGSPHRVRTAGLCAVIGEMHAARWDRVEGVSRSRDAAGASVDSRFDGVGTARAPCRHGPVSGSGAGNEMQTRLPVNPWAGGVTGSLQDSTPRPSGESSQVSGPL